MLFVIYVLIYVGVWSFKPKKTKKQGSFGRFAVCRGHGTRQSNRMGRPGSILCRVPKRSTRQSDHPSPCACRSGTRRSLKVCRVPAARAHGEACRFVVCPRRRHPAKSRQRRQLAVTASARFFSPCAYIYTRRIGLPCARHLAHGEQGLCRPRGCRRGFAVGHRRRNLCRVPTSLRRRHTANSRSPIVT